MAGFVKDYISQNLPYMLQEVLYFTKYNIYNCSRFFKIYFSYSIIVSFKCKPSFLKSFIFSEINLDFTKFFKNIRNHLLFINRIIDIYYNYTLSLL